jgi:hypothetical protein
MSSFATFTLKIMTIEDFSPELTDGYDDYERPGGYETVGGQKINADSSKLKMVSIMISPGRLVRCPVDVEAMGFKEDQDVLVVMSGRQVACVGNIEERAYVYFKNAIRRRYNSPRIVLGVNAAIAFGVFGYVVSLITRKIDIGMTQYIVDGAGFTLVVGSLLYAAYYFTNDDEAADKLRLLMRKVLK